MNFIHNKKLIKKLKINIMIFYSFLFVNKNKKFICDSGFFLAGLLILYGTKWYVNDYDFGSFGIWEAFDRRADCVLRSLIVTVELQLNSCFLTFDRYP